MAVVKKPQSAYFQFCAEKRKQVAQDNPGLRIGDIQKLITAQWKELTPEQKEYYTDLAAKDKERYEREKLENPVEVQASNKDDDAEAKNLCLYPLGRVKRIVQSDPDVNKVSRESLIAISKASELFVQFLATKAYEQTLYQNKRQIKASDVARAIQTTAVLDWLREDFPDIKAPKPVARTKHDKTGTSADSLGPGASTSGPSVASFFAARPGDQQDASGATPDADGSVTLSMETTADSANETVPPLEQPMEEEH